MQAGEFGSFEKPTDKKKCQRRETSFILCISIKDKQIRIKSY